MSNAAYDILMKHFVDDRQHPYVWFVKLFASKPIPCNQNSPKRKIMITEPHTPYPDENGVRKAHPLALPPASKQKNFYPDTTAHRLHLKGQEAAEGYVIQKQQDRIHVWGRRAFVIGLAALVVFQIVRVL